MKKVLCAMIAAKIVQIYHFLASYVKMCYYYKQRCQVLEEGLGSMAAIDRMLCQAAEHFLYIGTEEIFYVCELQKTLEAAYR